MFGAIEQNVLPDLVTDNDRIVFHTESREHLKFSAAYHRRAWIERRVHDNDTRAVAKHRLHRFPLETPMWRVQAHDAWHAACPADHRHVRIVQWLEQHHFVAWFDEREQRGSDRFGGAGGDGDFALPIEFNALMLTIVSGHRLAQVLQTPHRRILVGPLQRRARRCFENITRAVVLGKALSEIHCTVLGGEAGHGLEHSCAERGVNGIHARVLRPMRRAAHPNPLREASLWLKQGGAS
jgi:hypothetical protein